MASLPDRFDALPLSAAGHWTEEQLKSVVKLGWVNLSALGESAQMRLDPQSRQIRRDYLYFKQQLGDNPLSGSDINQIDLSPIIQGFERSREAALRRFNQVCSNLGEHDPLSIANFEEATRLETFRAVLDKHTRPFPYTGGNMLTDELKRLTKVERDITNLMGPHLSNPIQIMEFNQAEAQRRFQEMRLMQTDFGEAKSTEQIGSTRWATALNIGGPLAAIGLAALAIPEVREVVFNAGLNAVNAATDFFQNRAWTLP